MFFVLSLHSSFLLLPSVFVIVTVCFIVNVKLSKSLPKECSYETVLSTLYYSKQKNRAKEWISEATKNNFDILLKIIDKTIKENY